MLFAVILIASLLATGSAWKAPLWAATVSIFSFFLAQILLSGARLDWDHLFTAKNFAHLWFFGALVASPTLVIVFGVELGALPMTPSTASLNGAVIIYTLSYWAFCVGCHIRVSRQRNNPPPPFTKAAAVDRIQRILLIGLIALGLTGLFLRFGSPGAMIAFYLDTTNLLVTNNRASLSTDEIVGNLLRPFAFFGMIGLWANWCGSAKQKSKPLIVALVSAALLPIILMANLTFNRGTLVLAVLSMLAVYAAKIRPLRPTTLASIALTLWTIVAMLGEIRASGTDAVQAYSDLDLKGELIQENRLVRQAQTYLSGPQYLAFALDEMGTSGGGHWGLTILASAVAPIPIVGANWRENTGMIIYNELVYGKAAFVVDQIFPSQGEVLLNFGLIGIIPIYVVFGLIIGELHYRYKTAKKYGTGAELLGWMLLGYWLSMLATGCFSVVSQLIIYNAIGIFIFITVNSLFRHKVHTE